MPNQKVMFEQLAIAIQLVNEMVKVYKWDDIICHYFYSINLTVI